VTDRHVCTAIGRGEERATGGTGGGLVNHAEHGPARAGEADHDREPLAAADEVLRAVDRIDEPQPRRGKRGPGAPQLLADDRIARELRTQAGDDQLARALVGDRDRLVAELHLDAELAAAQLHHFDARGTRELHGGDQLAAELAITSGNISYCHHSATVAL